MLVKIAKIVYAISFMTHLILLPISLNHILLFYCLFFIFCCSTIFLYAVLNWKIRKKMLDKYEQNLIRELEIYRGEKYENNTNRHNI